MHSNQLDKIARDTAQLLNLSEEWVEKVVQHQWKETHSKLSECKSVEVSGLAKFKTRNNIIKRRIGKLVNMIKHYNELLISEREDKKVKSIDNILRRCKETIEYLQTKLQDEA